MVLLALSQVYPLQQCSNASVNWAYDLCQDRDDGAWNLAMAGGTCLTLVAAVVGQDVIALVMPFVQVCPSN